MVHSVLQAVGLVSPLAAAGGTIALQTLTAARARRVEAAREIALAEISESRVALLLRECPDDLFSMLSRYGRAAIEGAARDNLRLMARVISGFNVQAPMYASEFLALVDLLATLTPSEIQLLAIYVLVDAETPIPLESREVEVFRRVRVRAVPAVYSTEMEFKATCAAIGRTGMLLNNGAFDGGAYVATPRLAQLESLTRFTTL